MHKRKCVKAFQKAVCPGLHVPTLLIPATLGMLSSTVSQMRGGRWGHWVVQRETDGTQYDKR